MKFIVIIVPVFSVSILSDRRVPLTPLSFVPPGGWSEWWCELSSGRGGMGGRGEERSEEEGGEGSCSSGEL